MKKLILMLFMMLYSTSCAMGEVEIRAVKKHQSIDAEFTPYIQEFIYASMGRVSQEDFKGFTMGFKDYGDSTIIGTCHYSVYEVDINQKWWVENASPLQRYELVFHELGHCILKRGHTEEPEGDSFLAWLERLGFKVGLFEVKDRLYDGCPSSIMHPHSINEYCINQHFFYYIEELFGRDKKINYIEIKDHSRYLNSSCRTPQIINKTSTWTNYDQSTFERARARCVERYRSCLKTFWKNTEDSYSALCE